MITKFPKSDTKENVLRESFTEFYFDGTSECLTWFAMKGLLLANVTDIRKHPNIS